MTQPTADCGCNFCVNGVRDGMGHDDGPLVPWGSLRKPGEPPAPTMSEWVSRIAAASTPKRELDAEGRFRDWIRRDVA